MTKLYFPSTPAESKRYTKLCQQHIMRRVYRGIYTDDMDLPIETLIQRHWMEVVAGVVSKGILSFQTAMDLKPRTDVAGEATVTLTSTYTKTLKLPGLTVRVKKGNCEDFLEQVLPNLARSNEPRLLLENLKVHETKKVEMYLANRVLRNRGETALNQLRDESRVVAEKLNYQAQYQTLNKLISALLSTHPPETVLQTPYAKAVAKREPYDLHRLQILEQLSHFLLQQNLMVRDYTFNTKSFRNLSFFESYFSNFIEGTEFIIDEAEDIVFAGHEISHRHADSHDVLALFQIANDFYEMGTVPQTAAELIKLLSERHAQLMAARPDKQPGQFKSRKNKAGNTVFVSPEEVLGTLCQGFDIYARLPAGLAKALFMHFLISEVHPFNDGNGRMARLMMNAELVAAEQMKLIIPTVHRDNYLNGLRLITRQQQFDTYFKVMTQAHAYTNSIDWNDYGAARSKIETDYANRTPDEGLPRFNRALRGLR